MSGKQTITPCLWFNFNAEEAVNHYLGIFKPSRILEVSRYGDAVPDTAARCWSFALKLRGCSCRR